MVKKIKEDVEEKPEVEADDVDVWRDSRIVYDIFIALPIPDEVLTTLIAHLNTDFRNRISFSETRGMHIECTKESEKDVLPLIESFENVVVTHDEELSESNFSFIYADT